MLRYLKKFGKKSKEAAAYEEVLVPDDEYQLPEYEPIKRQVTDDLLFRKKLEETAEKYGIVLTKDGMYL